MRFVVLAIALVVVTNRPSAACSKRHQTPFELFGTATTVAVVTVRKTPSNSPDRIEAGDVELVASRVFKGPKVTAIRATESETDCRASYVVGTDIVVFLGDDGLTVGAHDGVLRDPAAWKPVIERWALATDDTRRATVLADAIAGGNAAIAQEAIAMLVDEPVLLDAVTPAQTTAIATAAKSLPKDPMITMLLVRLRHPSAPDRANVALWARAARGMLRAKDIVAETDPATLAAIVARGRRDDDPRRMAAMERCERVHGIALAPLGRYFGGAGSPAMWKDLAEACRTGTPIR